MSDVTPTRTPRVKLAQTLGELARMAPLAAAPSGMLSATEPTLLDRAAHVFSGPAEKGLPPRGGATERRG